VLGVSFAKLKAQVQKRNFEWDVVNLGDVEISAGRNREPSRAGRKISG
jgi:hypothetical protein